MSERETPWDKGSFLMGVNQNASYARNVAKSRGACPFGGGIAAAIRVFSPAERCESGGIGRVRNPLSPPSENKRVWERAKTAKLPGEVSEWLKEHGWKPCKHESASRVRIPLSPPVRRATLDSVGM